MIGKRPKNASSYGTMMLLAGVAILACAAQASTEPSWQIVRRPTLRAL